MSYVIVKKGATLIKGTPYLNRYKTLIISVSPSMTSIADETDSIDQIKEVFKNEAMFDTLSIPVTQKEEEMSSIIEDSLKYSQIVFCSYNANIYESQLTLIKKLQSQTVDFHVIAMRNPYDILFLNEIDNFTCLYEYSENSINVLKEYLKGSLELTGVSPISYE